MASIRTALKFKRGYSSSAFSRDVGHFSYTLFIFATWIPVVMFFNKHVGELTKINGKSMYPYFNTGYDETMIPDVVWVNKWNPLKNLQRGMIVTLWSPESPDVSVVKRIIALPGDKVITRSQYPVPSVRIPAGHVWVEGDNRSREQSNDSNNYGPISMNLITGKATHILYPWSRFGVMRWSDFKGKTTVIKSEVERS